MDGCRQRDVVLEIEQVKLIRKRARTSLRFCRGCGRSTDFILLTKAADLFGVTCNDVFDFMTENSCHYVVGSEGEVYLCLADVLTVMSKRINKGKIKMIGEQEVRPPHDRTGANG